MWKVGKSKNYTYTSPLILHKPRSCEMHWREQRSCLPLLPGRGFLCLHRFKRKRGDVKSLWINPPGKERTVWRAAGSTHLVAFAHGWLGKVLAQGLERAPQPPLKPHLGWSLQNASAPTAHRGLGAGWGALATPMDAKIKKKSDLRH